MKGVGQTLDVLDHFQPQDDVELATEIEVLTIGIVDSDAMHGRVANGFAVDVDGVDIGGDGGGGFKMRTKMRAIRQVGLHIAASADVQYGFSAAAGNDIVVNVSKSSEFVVELYGGKHRRRYRRIRHFFAGLSAHFRRCCHGETAENCA
jgi:hypothetical protein